MVHGVHFCSKELEIIEGEDAEGWTQGHVHGWISVDLALCLVGLLCGWPTAAR